MKLVKIALENNVNNKLMSLNKYVYIFAWVNKPYFEDSNISAYFMIYVQL